MRRIAIFGNGGGGKSTLARALGRHLRRPVYEVDEVQWLSGSMLLLRTLRRVEAMHADLLDLVTREGRATKLVHLRSPRDIARWLDDVTRTL